MRQVIILVMLFMVPAVWGQTVYRCVGAGGKIEYRDYPCKATARPQPQPPSPTPQRAPSTAPSNTSSALDAYLRSRGFDGYAGYQRAKTSCLNQISSYALAGPSSNCSLSDINCFSRAADAMSARYQQLVSTPAWRQNGCEVVVQLERGTGAGSSSSGTYVVEVSHNDELFIINGEKFKAKTYCFDMEKGDRVKFIEGSALGACATARLLNMRTERICNVWCE